MRHAALHSWPNFGSLLRPSLLGFGFHKVLGLLVVLGADIGGLLVLYNLLDIVRRAVVELQVGCLGLAELVSYYFLLFQGLVISSAVMVTISDLWEVVVDSRLVVDSVVMIVAQPLVIVIVNCYCRSWLYSIYSVNSP